MDDFEYILCAAIWVDDGKERLNQPVNIKTGIVFCGFRHLNCISTIASYFYPNWKTDPKDNEIRIKTLWSETQGFLTSKNRFVNRKEAAEIALQFGQVHSLKYDRDDLYSEDLY